ncbi:OX-2 membrane glycoprotein-like [Meriones unguiculatus]|uniref:OX-2 membrane glycoprotein-like n=1 Tax=Meriones unguiculatus TaxID=10047 RepID=UPI00293EC903|nr:OX-2 membrane glycoprotein-like [Meriones unguiculatus]
MDFSLQCILLHLLLLLCTQESESLLTIKHNDYETAFLRGDVTIFCNLTSLANVEQITWQKIQGSLPQNIGTYSRKYGEKILPPYVNRLHCKILEPSASFITIQKVTFEDKTCYKCLMNTFPYGSHGGQTCLNILTVSELVTELQSVPGSEDLHHLHCSALGKPAPGISIHPSQAIVSTEEYSVQNRNTTVTVTKSYNISLKTVMSLGLHNLVVSMTHPLRHEEKIVPLPLHQEKNSFYKDRICPINEYDLKSENVPEPSSTQMPSPLSTLLPTAAETENITSHHDRHN